MIRWCLMQVLQLTTTLLTIKFQWPPPSLRRVDYWYRSLKKFIVLLCVFTTVFFLGGGGGHIGWCVTDKMQVLKPKILFYRMHLNVWSVCAPSRLKFDLVCITNLTGGLRFLLGSAWGFTLHSETDGTVGVAVFCFFSTKYEFICNFRQYKKDLIDLFIWMYVRNRLSLHPYDTDPSYKILNRY